MRSDNNQLDIYRDDARAADPAMAERCKAEAKHALSIGDTMHFTAKERHDYWMAEAAKYEPQ